MTNTYCALYRKYRPSTLDDIVGQNVIIRTLKNSITNSHISHAYLFSGPRGTGKTSIAKILSKTLNCTNLDGIVPCNKCVSCTQINNKQNIDIIEIDAASNNGVDEIREIRNKVNLVPSTSKYKIYIIDEVHMLTTGAFNALLKTLEEPPSHIIFILATTEPQKIPNTILSRCQRFDFKRISIEDIVYRLKYICKEENVSIEENALIQIAISSDGGMRDAIGMLDQAIAYTNNNITQDDIHEIVGTISEQEINQFVEYLLNNDLLSLINKINIYYQSGKNILKIIEEIVIFLKNILIYYSAPEYFEINNIDDENYKSYVNVEPQKILDIISYFVNETTEIRKSATPKMLFELLIIKIISVNKENTVPHNINIQKSSVINKQNSNINTDNSIKLESKDNEHIIRKNEVLKNLRVSNTLARFNKQITINLKKQFENLNSLLIDSNISQTVSMIIDGNLKAASDEYIIFVFDTENEVNLFNNNIVSIESVIANFINNNYKVIAVQNKEWQILKNEFNNKTKVFEYNDEIKNDFNESLDKKIIANNSIDGLFGESIEYEN